jgi:tripartite-type tricarboxylate transporter receptor subunit TctC
MAICDITDRFMKYSVGLLSGLCVLLISFSTPVRADQVAEFYHGKTISIYVGFPPGGGYDIYARVLARHFGDHVPGNPVILIRNMAGGSGVRAASYLTNATPQDGTSLGLFLDTTTLGKVLGGPGEFDPAKMVWIGRIVSTESVAMVWHTAPAQSVEEAKRTPIAMAVTQPGTSTSLISSALNDLIGTKFKIVHGYQGSPPMALAMESGEVDAIGGISWESVKLTKQEWLSQKKAKVLYGLGAHRLKDLPSAPSLLDLAVDEKSRKLLNLFGSAPDIGRAIVAEPGVPLERAEVLRDAFMATMEDPAFEADMAKAGLNIEPLSGSDLQRIVADIAATPQDLVEQAKRYVGP